MASSYLATSFFFPLKQEPIEEVLSQPIGLPSHALKALINQNVAGISQKKSSGVIYHPDYCWIENHIDYLSKLTGWQWLALRNLNLGMERRKVALGLDGLSISSYEMMYIAFAYADAALAERLASALTSDQQALFTIMPTSSEKEALYLLLSKFGFEQMGYEFPYLRHPLRLCLEGKVQELEANPCLWLNLDLHCRAESLEVTHQNWQQFVDSQYRDSVTRANKANPIYLGQHHFTDGKQVFFRHIGDEVVAVPLVACDINTFKEVEDRESNGWYAVDATHLWNCGEHLPCKTPKQFKELPQHWSYFTDGSYVYHENRVLEETDASQVRAVPGSRWHDCFLHENIFYPSYGRSYLIDGASFRALGSRYYADKDGVYEFGDGELIVIEGFDPTTFEVIELDYGEVYLKDHVRVAYARKSGLKPKFIKGVDVAKFTLLAGLPFCSDGKRVWLEGRECKDLDATDIRPPPVHPEYPNTNAPTEMQCKYFLCKKQAFYIDSNQYQVLADVDVESFEVLSLELARDKNHIWERGLLIQGAIASGFVWQEANEMRWTDGESCYWGGDLIKKNTKYFYAIDRDLSLVGNDYYLEDKKIEGWSSITHRESNLNCIEDENYYYSCFTHSGGAILVWPKTYSHFPLTYYQLDKNSNTWRLASAVPTVQELATIPQGTIITQEEFDTLFDSINKSAGYEEIESVSKDPSFVVLRWRDSRLIEIKGDVNYRAMWYGDAECNESVSPIWTPGIYQKVRAALDWMLEYESPISFATLTSLLERLPADMHVQAFPLNDFVNGKEIEANMDLQSGVDSVRGVWIDAKINGQVLRMMVTEENGFLSGMCYTGALSLYRQVNYEGFEAEGWTADRRMLFRQLIDTFLETASATPISNSQPSKNHWDHPCIAELVNLIAPQISKAKRKKMVGYIISACNTGMPEHLEIAGNDYATTEGVAWETLLEQLESEGLLVIFNKDDPYATVDLCNQLAVAVGFEASYEPSEDENGESFYTIARDFDRWLAPHSYCLIWPQGSLGSNGDDLFPAVIAPMDNLGAINEQLNALGGYRRFLYTSKW